MRKHRGTQLPLRVLIPNLLCLLMAASCSSETSPELGPDAGFVTGGRDLAASAADPATTGDSGGGLSAPDVARLEGGTEATDGGSTPSAEAGSDAQLDDDARTNRRGDGGTAGRRRDRGTEGGDDEGDDERGGEDEEDRRDRRNRRPRP